MATLQVKSVNLVTVKKGTEKESKRIAINLTNGDVVFVSTQILCHQMELPYTKSNGERVTAKMILEQKNKSKDKKGA